jgi:hypothetical protein
MDRENFRYVEKGQPEYHILTYPTMVTLYSILVIVTVVLIHLIGFITALNRTFPLATLSYALLISSKGSISVITLTLPLAA